MLVKRVCENICVGFVGNQQIFFENVFKNKVLTEELTKHNIFKML